MILFTRAWWKAAGLRAAYTVLAALLPLAGQVGAGTVEWAYVGGVLALAAIASMATSLVSLPEVKDKQLVWWRAILYRSARTLGQVIAAAAASAVLVQELDWPTVAVTAGGALATTLVRTVLGALPEAPAPEDPGL